MTKTPLDPSIQKMQDKWKASGIPQLFEGGNGPVSRERGENVRALLYPKPKLKAGKIENLKLDDGVPIRIIHPNKGKAKGTMLYFHGGGWIVGSIDSHEAHCIRYANQCGLVVVSVEYRLAPEHPYPAGITDAKSAFHWVHKNLNRLGGENNPYVVGGDSAGGNFATIIAIYAKNQGIKLAAQVLLYPATDLRGANDPVVHGQYLGENGKELAQNEDVSPIVSDLTGIAPVILAVGVYDFLYKDNLAYEAALRKANVPLDMMVYETLNHGFFSFVSISKASLKAANEVCDRLKKYL